MDQFFGYFWDSFVQYTQDLFFWLGNTFIKAVAGLLSWLSGLFPSYVVPAPGQALDFGGQFYSTLNWIFPVSYCIALVGVFIAVYSLLFTGGFILRFIGVIR